MPSGLMMADSNFPRFVGGESTEQKISTIQNYLFQLTEQLRWSYANIGKENFNEKAYTLIAEDIRGPVVKRFESLDLKVTNGEGNTASIQITGDGLKTEAQVIEFQGMVTFKELASEGKTADRYTVIDGAKIKTGEILSMTMRSSKIIGNEIEGGTIIGTEIYGGSYTCTLENDADAPSGEIIMRHQIGDKNPYKAGGLRLEYDSSVSGDSETESRYVMRLFTRADPAGRKFALKLQSGHRMSLEANGLIYIDANGDEITLHGKQINLNAGDIYLNARVHANYGIYANGTQLG